ncbi:bacterial extracellular solute-binding family protein [Escherichia coli 2726950]|nr:bacterial extracellular solute-binding family protein [Escherichia coli 2722950]ENA55051.1 bacterial extracellular solute-binding family protein [Escherichia coli 2726950]ENB23345.1 bacterial extracellular solute-binding family protein [Escherichia coli BCE011_MS-01]
MIKSKIVLLSALVSCALISGCKEENKTNISIEFMHSSVEQERQAVISKLIARFEKENPGITVKQVPVEEDAYNTKVITLSRSGSLPEVIETSHDYAKVMDKEQLIDRKAVATVISNVGEGAFYDGVLRIVRTEDGSAGPVFLSAPGLAVSGIAKMCWQKRGLRSRKTGNSCWTLHRN